MKELKKINKFLIRLYKEAGLKLKFERGTLQGDYNEQTLQNIIECLKKVKEQYPNVYFHCLSILIFYSYAELTCDFDVFKNLNEERNALICKYELDQENEILKEFPLSLIRENMDEILEKKERLLFYIKEAKNIEEFDVFLEENDDNELLEIMASYHIGSMVEVSNRLNASVIFDDFSYLFVYKKYVPYKIIENVFDQAITYKFEEDAMGLIDFIESIDIGTNSKKKAYLLHKYIIARYNDQTHIENMTEYIHTILWMTYIRGIIGIASHQVTDELRDYVHLIQEDDDCITTKTNNLMMVQEEIPAMFSLFINNYSIGDFFNNDCDVESLSFAVDEEDSIKMKEKVRQYVKSQAFLKMD